MNYYPFHLGDYAAHTAHLEPIEDLAYRRILDLYYRTESAIPLDVREVSRLIRLRSYENEITQVLLEFFIQAEDGWHSKRADEELTAMLAKQEQQAIKDEHEAERMRRYRERRSVMFAALRHVGVWPAWDVPMKELQRLHDVHCNGPATDLQREHAPNGNGPATAIPTPTPTPTPLVVCGSAQSANPPTPPVDVDQQADQPQPADAVCRPLNGSTVDDHEPPNGVVATRRKKRSKADLSILVGPPVPPPAFDGSNAEALNGKSVVPVAVEFSLPAEWGFDAEKLGFKPTEVLRESEKWRQYWTVGKGSGTTRSVRGWRQSWSNWLDKASKEHRR